MLCEIPHNMAVIVAKYRKRRMIMAVIHLNKDNFEEITREGLALVDFWATWCGPCRMQAPVVDQLDTELGASVKVCKVDVDAEPALARKFRVMSIPTLIALKDGQIKETRVGYQDLQSLKDMLK